MTTLPRSTSVRPQPQQSQANVPDTTVDAPNRAVIGFPAAERDALILANYDLVKAIARKIRSRLPRGVDVDDLIGYGVVGLIESIDRYDHSRSVPFEAFARPRIQGAILDALRALDWVPRSVRRKADLLSRATTDLKESLGRAPNREELAASVGVEVDKLDKLERGAQIRTIASLDAPLGGQTDTTLGATVPSDDEDLLTTWEHIELTDELVDAVARLPERERVAVQMYYLEECSLKEIGGLLGVSESRACQLRRQGIERLQFKVRHHIDA